MKVNVKLFAAARQLVSADSVEVEVTDPVTVERVRAAMAQRYPKLDVLLRHAMFAVNAEYVQPHERIPIDAEVACIPPVSGG